jgi:hypothetical protein
VSIARNYQLPYQPQQPPPAPVNPFIRIFRKVAAVVDDMNYATRLMSVRGVSYEQYLSQPNAAPETYEEFLLRSRGPRLREPTARARAAGRKVR